MTQQRNLLTGGLRLTLQSWPALVWTYVLNLGLAVFFTLPLRSQIAGITAHSLASQRLTGAFDLGALGGVIGNLSKGPGPAVGGTYFSIPIYFLLYFLIVPGALVCYQTGSSSQLFPLLQSGFAHFWRFVRLTLMTLVIAGPILAGLNALENLWSTHVDKTIVGRPGFLLGLAGLIVVLLVAALLRVYFDLMQVYTVQLGLQTESGQKAGRQIRRTFKPAWKALCANFLRTYLTFVLLTVVGFAAVFITARAAMHSMAQPRVWPMFLLAQIGLFLSLLTRFWQRGAETILVLDNPIPIEAVVAPEPVVPVAEPAAAQAENETAKEASGGGAEEFSI